jgi:hypothetical protein
MTDPPANAESWTEKLLMALEKINLRILEFCDRAKEYRYIPIQMNPSKQSSALVDSSQFSLVLPRAQLNHFPFTTPVHVREK